ncbi:Hypothetical protein PSEBR_m1615 [Pseudomonas brassicacearum subsp. brassicacearum NFM421]|uniref:Uncharacterized protein n=1 Tax=Pseudomonas brassicacearum (strain NFM421) TaxID=994484 RepID=F2KM78_PSEBN|nr:Hypothetical protein PSEBR_m1615 [Pseudomonas brassicacearum subsp. brassicacearum NFM421]
MPFFLDPMPRSWPCRSYEQRLDARRFAFAARCSAIGGVRHFPIMMTLQDKKPVIGQSSLR